MLPYVSLFIVSYNVIWLFVFSFPPRDVRVLRLSRGKMLTTIFTKSLIDLAFYSKYKLVKKIRLKVCYYEYSGSLLHYLFGESIIMLLIDTLASAV